VVLKTRNFWDEFGNIIASVDEPENVVDPYTAVHPASEGRVTRTDMYMSGGSLVPKSQHTEEPRSYICEEGRKESSLGD
jgi:hypothetical protein